MDKTSISAVDQAELPSFEKYEKRSSLQRCLCRTLFCTPGFTPELAGTLPDNQIWQ
jgi:hypothetical protein